MNKEVLDYTAQLCEILTRKANEIRKGINTATFTFKENKKYLRVEMNDSGRSVHCFVDKNTGDVYKAASWFKPATGVRYKLLDEASRQNCFKNCDIYGGYLYHGRRK